MQNFCLNEKRMHKQQVSLLLKLKIFRCVAVSMPFVLTGCNATLPLDQKCPEPNPIPAELAKSDVQNAKNYSAKVSDWFKRVENYLKVFPFEKIQ